MSGGIARDRSTTAQRSRQGSKTATGRKRSSRERADLDGANGVEAWVDTASPSMHANLPQASDGPGRHEAHPNAGFTDGHFGWQLFGTEFLLA